MPSTLANLLSLLQDGTTLLLPNARAARELRSAFDAQQRAAQLQTWQPAAAIAWQQWTTSLWSGLIVSGLETRLLLNAAQEHALWVEVIADDPEHSSLATGDSLAELAHAAWQLAAAHNATPQLRSSATTHDSRIFAAWAEEFSQRCATRSYLSAAQLDHALHLHALSGNLKAPAGLHLVGFSDITPSQKLLVDALSENGTAITHHALTTDAPRQHAVLIAPTHRDELHFAAQYIYELLHTKSDARIAVLVPDLAADHGELESVLRSTLTPELQSIDSDLSSTPWEFTSGSPLGSLPIVADALSLARFALNPLPLEGITALLLSPYLGEPTETGAAALFDANTLRRQTLLRPELDLAALTALDRDATLPWLRNVQFFLQRQDLTKARTYADWMQMLRGISAAAHWPGPRALNASDFAATVAFDGLLDLVSTLDFAGRRVPFAAALGALERHAQTTPSTPSSSHACIQIMSPADIAASLFDAVVFLRCTDANWPPATRPNPLLSWQLQRSLSMPGADPALTAERARELTLSLLQRTPNVLFTSAAEDANGQLRPSPLVAELNIKERQDFVISTEDAHSAPEWRDLQGIKNRIIPYDLVPDADPLPPLPQTEVHGGANLLKLQAACGFRAFAQLRLYSTQPGEPALGLDAAENGSLLHTVMQHLWSTIHSQKELADLAAEGRSKLLQRSIDSALHKESIRLLSAWDTAYHDILRERLHALLLPWLDVELARSPFTVVATERSETITIGPLSLNVRVDRIDQVANGTVLIDYKTGSKATPSQWLGLRPDEPQLPLYTLLFEPGELQAVAFAHLRAGDAMRYNGMQAQAGTLPRVRSTTNLDSEQHNWLTVLNNLAHQFANSEASVDPKDYPTTCSHCIQRPLCRIDPTSRPTAEETEDA